MSDRRSSMPLPRQPDVDPRRRARRRWAVALVVLLVLGGAGGGWYLRGRSATVPPSASNPDRVARTVVDDSLAYAPTGVRVRVRVVNATDIRGLARRATSVLRDLGYDVVEFDGDPKANRDRSLVLSHTGHDDWGARLTRALGDCAIEPSRDSSHYVDFTVLIGRDWTAPVQPLRP